MAKLALLVGAGVGYVLGARAGRERYEQIEAQARRVWKDPRVQEKKNQAQAAASEKGAELKDKAADKAAEKASSSTKSSGSDPAAGSNKGGTGGANGSGTATTSASRTSSGGTA